jgi:hypothetical protein
MTVSDDGSNTKCQNYEEQAEQAEGEQSAFETWHEADGLFEAPVDELIVLTARKDESGTVVVSTTQINQYANELQQRVEAAQAGISVRERFTLKKITEVITIFTLPSPLLNY